MGKINVKFYFLKQNMTSSEGEKKNVGVIKELFHLY